MTEQSFEVFYNSLSVGWHLRKIAEADQEPMTPEQWVRFVGWMQRHHLIHGDIKNEQRSKS